MHFNPPHLTLSFGKCRKISVVPEKSSSLNALKQILCKIFSLSKDDLLKSSVEG